VRDVASQIRSSSATRRSGGSVSIRKIAAAAGLGPTRVHAIVRYADLDSFDTALGDLRSPYAYGWLVARQSMMSMFLMRYLSSISGKTPRPEFDRFGPSSASVERTVAR
jgi:hypothetical protein